MALTTRQDHVRWPDVASYANLPNVAGSPAQNSALVRGQTCFSTGDTTLYVCTTATVGAAVWEGLNISGALSLPGIQQVLFVDKTSGAYVPDGTIQYPYNSINSALTAAAALTPGPTNRIGIVVMSGIYNETFTLRNYCYVIGMDKETTVAYSVSGHMITAAGVTSGVWNMTIEQDPSSPYYLANITGASDIEFRWVHFISAGDDWSDNEIYSTDTSVLKFWHCQFDIENVDLQITRLEGSSSHFFYDCQISGQVYAASTATTSRLFLKDCVVNGTVYTWGQNSLEVYCTEIDARNGLYFSNPIFIGSSEEFVVLFNLNLIPKGTAADVSFGSRIAIECNNVKMVNGSDRFGFLLSQEGEAHIGGRYDFYSSWTNMVQASWTGRGKYRIILHEDITTASINLSGVHDPVTIDGQGEFSISHPTPGLTISLSTGWTGDQWTFERLTFNDSLQISTPFIGPAAAVFKGCTINGAIKHSVGSNPGTLLIELIHTEVIGNSTDLYALMIAQNSLGTPAKIIVRGDSYLQGYVGNPAIYWHTFTGPGDLRMAFSTILHGSLGANNPMGDDGTPTPPIPYRATHCRFNADPDLGNVVNSIAAAQRFNSFDPLVAF